MRLSIKKKKLTKFNDTELLLNLLFKIQRQNLICYSNNFHTKKKYIYVD